MINLKSFLKKYIPSNILELIINGFKHLQFLIKSEPLIDVNPKYIKKIYDFGKRNKHTFFGYYDLSPLDTSRQRLLLSRVDPRDSARSDLLCVNINEGTEHRIASTSAWNWQQGSRLRWYSEEEVSFNDTDKGQYVCRFINLSNGNEKLIDFPLYDFHSSSGLGVTLDFERLGEMRPGYGYKRLNSDGQGKMNFALGLINISSNQLIKQIGYDDILGAYEGHLDWLKEDCYINHVSISPDGTKFIFFFINECRGNHCADLLLYHVKDSRIQILERGEKVSHYVWVNNDDLLCTVINKDKSCHYMLYDTYGRRNKVLDYRDGHPSMVSESTVLSDTYPNNRGFQSLFVFDIRTKKKVSLASIYSVFVSDTQRRTDLHPRYMDGLISIDANTNGYRKSYLLATVGLDSSVEK